MVRQISVNIISGLNISLNSINKERHYRELQIYDEIFESIIRIASTNECLILIGPAYSLSIQGILRCLNATSSNDLLP